MNCLIDTVHVLDCSNFRSDNCLQLVYCSMVFVNCIDLHLSLLLHTFVLSLRLELKSKTQDLIQGKKIKIFLEDQGILCAFSGETQGKKKIKNCV